MTPQPLKALFFTAIFLVGNLLLPEADILLGHELNQENETRVHLEALGGCRNHAEHCALSRLLGELSGPAPAASPAFAVAASASAPLRPAGIRFITPRAFPFHRSRAPPASPR